MSSAFLNRGVAVEISLKKLLYFKTIVEQGQISRAARVLHVSQPPLSKRLKELEEDLGVTLIHRSGTDWEVTKAGRTLYQRALDVLDLVEDIPQEVRDSSLDAEGAVTIGCTTLSMSLLYDFIPKFHRAHPRITVQLVVEDSSALRLRLLEHGYDFGLMVVPEDTSGLKVVDLPPVRPCVVVPASMATEPFKRAAREGRPLDIACLDGLPMAVFRRAQGGGVYLRTMDIFGAYKVRPHIVVNSPSSETIVNLLEHGLEALGLVPRSEIPARLESSCLLCDLPEDFPSVQCCMAQVERRYLSRAARVTWEALNGFVAGK